MDTIKSAMWRLSQNDFIKGLFMFVFAAILDYVKQYLTAGSDILNVGEVWNVALLAAVTYLSKNLATDEKGKLFGKV
jgi:hypothetical protein